MLGLKLFERKRKKEKLKNKLNLNWEDQILSMSKIQQKKIEKKIRGDTDKFSVYKSNSSCGFDLIKKPQFIEKLSSYDKSLCKTISLSISQKPSFPKNTKYKCSWTIQMNEITCCRRKLHKHLSLWYFGYADIFDYH